MCIREKEYENSSNWRLKRFAGSSRLSISRKEACTLQWLECEESGQMETARSREYFASKTFPRDTCKTFCFASLSNLIHTFFAYTIYTHITHKCWGEFLRENPSQTTWKLEIVISTILYTFVLGISSSSTSSFPYHWEVNSPNTYHTLWEFQVIVWCCWEALEEAKDGRCNMELVAGFGVLDKTRFRKALLE